MRFICVPKRDTLSSLFRFWTANRCACRDVCVVRKMMDQKREERGLKSFVGHTHMHLPADCATSTLPMFFDLP